MHTIKGMMSHNNSNFRRIPIVSKKDNRFCIRLKKDESAIVEALRIKWQLPSKSKVLHRLIAISNLLETEKSRLIREKDELLKKIEV